VLSKCRVALSRRRRARTMAEGLDEVATYLRQAIELLEQLYKV
jgi:hypothetical protein